MGRALNILGIANHFMFPLQQSQEPNIRYVAKYKCLKCNIKWKLRNSTGHIKPCEKCGVQVYPYKKQVGIGRYYTLALIVCASP